MLDLGTTFLASVERSPHAIAIVDGDTRLTYAQWMERVGAVAGGLAQLGVKHGDHLALVLQNRWEAATLHWACQLLGVIITPLNWRLKADEVDYCVADAGARAVVYETLTAGAIEGSAACRKLPRIGIGDAAGATHRFDELLKASVPQQLVNASADDWSVMLYPSGTTGRPKGVPRRHRAERAAALAHVAQNLYAFGERTLGVMPLYHTMGVRSLLAMALIDGRFVAMPRFDASEALRLIAAERVTNLYLVPTLYHDLLAHPDCAGTDLSSCTKLGFAGAPMTDGLLKRLTERFRPQLFVNHFGSSEVYTYTINQNAPAKPGCAGRASLNTRIRVMKLGSENPDELAQSGEEGHIIADRLSDEAFEGYWNRPEADAKALHGGWFFTGDTGYFDADGELFVTGRVDDMIISGGENISPIDIESVLSLHPGVDEVAVAGVQDERWGQKVVAFVKRKTRITAQELDDYCRDSVLMNFKRPREYVFVTDVPKSPVGKILRRKLTAGEYQKEETADEA